jgi:hypothetical protein
MVVAGLVGRILIPLVNIKPALASRSSVLDADGCSIGLKRHIELSSQPERCGESAFFIGKARHLFNDC